MADQRCSRLAGPDSLTKQDSNSSALGAAGGVCSFYYFSTNALFAFLMLSGHLYLILSFFHFHFEHLCAATGLIFVLLTATVAAFVNVNEV